MKIKMKDIIKKETLTLLDGKLLNTDILHEAYDTLTKTGLVKSKADFSVCWLHKSERYYSALKTQQREASVEALATLAARLATTAQRMKAYNLWSTEARTEALGALADKVAQALQDRALARGLRTRKRITV